MLVVTVYIYVIVIIIMIINLNDPRRTGEGQLTTRPESINTNFQNPYKAESS